jgi:hypothetical protein
VSQLRKNEPTVARRTCTLLVFEDDGVTPAPLATVGFTVQVRVSGGSYAAAAGTFINTGVDGEWEYEASQAETNHDAAELVVLVTKTGFTPARAIMEFETPSLANLLGLHRHNSVLDGGSGHPSVQYDANGVVLSARLRVFASSSAASGATAGHADNADSEIARYTVTGVSSSGRLASMLLVPALEP